MGDFKVKHDYAWKRPADISVKDAGAWKPVKTLYVNDAGVWKPVWVRPGAQTFTASGTFTVPAGVYSICLAIISGGKPGVSGGSADSGGPGSGGAGGDGGTLAYKNSIAVTPGQTITVTISAARRVDFGSYYVLPGLGGHSGNFDVVHLGGPGGAGQNRYYDFGYGFPGGAGGEAGFWGPVGSEGAGGQNAPGYPNNWAAQGGAGTDLLGTKTTSAGSAQGGVRGQVYDGGNGATYGGGGGGGHGQSYGGGTGPTYGGVGGPGALRVIWGTGKSFPSAANF